MGKPLAEEYLRTIAATAPAPGTEAGLRHDNHLLTETEESESRSANGSETENETADGHHQDIPIHSADFDNCQAFLLAEDERLAGFLL